MSADFLPSLFFPFPQEFSRQVTTSEGKAFADRIGCLFIGESPSFSLIPSSPFFTNASNSL